jgi:hypothetical protein
MCGTAKPKLQPTLRYLPPQVFFRHLNTALPANDTSAFGSVLNKVYFSKPIATPIDVHFVTVSSATQSSFRQLGLFDSAGPESKVNLSTADPNSKSSPYV